MHGELDDAMPWLGAAGEMATRVRGFAWDDTPLGPPSNWPAELRGVVALTLASPLVASVAVGRERRLIYNDAAARLYGDRHPGVLGQPLAMAFPDSYPAVEAAYDRVFAGESVTVRAQPLELARGGEVFDAYLTPVRTPDGAVAAAHMVGLEVGDRFRAEQELRDQEERFRAFVTASSDVVYRMGPDWTEMRQLEGRSFLSDTAEPNRDWLDRYILPEDQPVVNAAIERAIAGRTLFELEHRVIRVDGSPGWTHSRAAPILDEAGEIKEWLGTATDVTEKVRIATALRESESLRSIALAGGRMGTWRWDMNAQMVSGDEQFLALWGLPPSDDPLPLALFTARQSPDGLGQTEELVSGAITAGEEFDAPIEVVSGPTAGRWLRWRGRTAPDSPSVLYGVTFDITEQKLAEARRRDSEERQAFLLELSDALRPLDDPGEIQRVAMAVLCRNLGVTRANYYEVSDDQEHFRVTGTCSATEGAMPDPHLRFSTLGFLGAAYRAGETLVFDDIGSDARLDPSTRDEILARGAHASVVVPLVKSGRLLTMIGVHQATPRAWSAFEVAMLQETAERTWAAVERARVEAALRESEERQRLMVELVPAMLWSTDAVGGATAPNATWRSHTGQSIAETQAFGWLDAIHPDDLAATRKAFEHAFATGQPLERQQRIKQGGAGYRWHLVRHVPVRDPTGRIIRWFGAAIDVHDLHEAQERQQLLLGELQHRVRNILGVIRSVFSRTVETGGSIEEIADHFRGRLDSLARTQVIGTQTPSGKVDLDSLLRDELLSVGAAGSPAVKIEGPEVALPAAAAETMGLAIHELTTNALKYGALSVPGGSLTIAWAINLRYGRQRWLDLTWSEQGVPAIAVRPARYGFGRELIEEALPYRLRAETTLEFRGGGVRCTIGVPLGQDGASAGSEGE